MAILDKTSLVAPDVRVYINQIKEGESFDKVVYKLAQAYITFPNMGIPKDIIKQLKDAKG